MRPIVTAALGFASAALLSAATAAWCASPAAPAQPDAAATPSALKSAGGSTVHHVKAALAKIAPRMLADRRFAKAEKEFPTFCRDWESKLRDRERNNIAHLSWKDSNGLETSTYTGYGRIQSCTCTQSSKGIPVGKLYYQEFEYRLEGKTLDEARRATPKPDAVTNTTEIFRWDQKQDKWIY